MSYSNIIIGIYKITNLINGKSYIGHSKHILQRWTQHRYDSKTKQLPLYRAIRKYGIENFKFEILEECKVENLSKIEDYYINKYSTYIPKGYNYNKAETHFTNILIPDKYLYIKDLLKNTNIPMTEIGKEVGLSSQQIQKINKGISWRQDNENYPLRKTYNNYDSSLIIPLLKQNLTIKEIANKLNTTEGTIQGFMQSNDIHTSDFRKRITSNKKTIQLDKNNIIINKFNTIKEAAEYLSKKTNCSLNTALCGIKRNLDKDKLYKDFYWKRVGEE